MGDLRRYYGLLKEIYSELEDICLELTDEGIDVDIRNLPNFDDMYCCITIRKPNKKRYWETEKMKYSEVKDTVDRLTDFLKSKKILDCKVEILYHNKSDKYSIVKKRINKLLGDIYEVKVFY